MEALFDPANQIRFGVAGRLDRNSVSNRGPRSISSPSRTLRTQEMTPVGGHCRNVANHCFQEGLTVDQVCAAFSSLGSICIETLKEGHPGPALECIIDERLSMAIQFGIGEIIDEFEMLSAEGCSPCGTGLRHPAGAALLPDR